MSLTRANLRSHADGLDRYCTIGRSVAKLVLHSAANHERLRNSDAKEVEVSLKAKVRFNPEKNKFELVLTGSDETLKGVHIVLG